jgi:23S rRNA (uracil1939-C5)-methyltransferase
MTDRITLTLTDMAHGGAALGHHEGRVIFVPYGVPGDEVVIALDKQKKGWARGHIEDILTPSPNRQEPRCPHFGPHKCGGCQWQHIRYLSQLEYKRDVLRDQLGRLGGLKDIQVKATIAPGPEWEYRNNIQLHPCPDGLGYVNADGNDIYPIDSCPLVHPLLANLLDQIDVDPTDFDRVAFRASLTTGRQMVILYSVENTLFETEIDIPVSCLLMQPDGRWITLAGADNLVENVQGIDFTISADSFFQVNIAGAQVLVDTVTALAQPQPHEVVVDLYAGVGLFSLTLAEKAGRITAIESYSPAATDAETNLQAANIDNVQIINADVAVGLDAIDDRVDTVILDPPRAGCGESVVQRILTLQPRKVVYVSYDPATLARDASLFAANSYIPQAFQPVDMFPQTYHIETVALFVKQ